MVNNRFLLDMYVRIYFFFKNLGDTWLRFHLQAKNNESEGCWDDLDDILESEGHIRDNQVTWSAADKELLAPSIGLIKASKSCVKKVSVAVKKNGSCECEGNVSQLDDLADKVQAVSPLVDDLAASLYAPMKQDMVRQNVSCLVMYFTLKFCYLKFKITHR